MLNAQTRSARNHAADPDLLRALCGDIRSELESKRNALAAEIRNYPPPIPACDAHFNYLLEERAKVAHEITLCDELCGRDRADTHYIDVIDEFVRSCAYIDAAAKQNIRARLRESP